MALTGFKQSLDINSCDWIRLFELMSLWEYCEGDMAVMQGPGGQE
jgi:hypothetical protein